MHGCCNWTLEYAILEPPEPEATPQVADLPHQNRLSLLGSVPIQCVSLLDKAIAASSRLRCGVVDTEDVRGTVTWMIKLL